MKKTILTYACLLVVSIVVAQVSTKEKQALLDLYNATNGPNWKTGWDLQKPVASWHGITVENNVVSEISLLFNNLEGTIPPSIGDLANLKKLELSFNKISGNLPPELGQLHNLEILALNGDQLQGNIPAELGNLLLLKQLHLSSNQLSGSIPESFGNLQQLEIFNVFDNNLYGALPKEFANSQHLTQLMVAENNFTNSNDFSVILLSNSGAGINLNKNAKPLEPKGSIIAIESEDSDN